MTQYLVLLETSGNQNFIFDTNKLRENVGASQLTWQSCDLWVREVLGSTRRDREVLFASGKAYLRASSEPEARGIIQAVTTKALKHAPGLDLAGVSVTYEAGGLHEAIPKAHRLLAERKGLTPGPATRFQRLPVVAECGTSGYPAAEVGRDPDNREVLRSAVSVAKRNAAGSGIERMRQIASAGGGRDIIPSVDELDRFEGIDWLGVVHADGNGLGQVFLNFHECAQTKGDDDYIAKLQAFSQALDEAAAEAFRHALRQMHARRNPRSTNERLPVVPVVLGGDDLTVVLDGKHAIRFAIDYLEAFEALTGKEPTITDITKGPVTACAGVAVVKPHFPFSTAYDLAEELIGSAKKFAKPGSRIDFHILYDASGTDFKRIRNSQKVDGSVTNLTARPYKVSKSECPRTTETLHKKIHAVRAKSDGKPVLPNSLLHDLREALFLGREAADAKFGLVRQRYPGFSDLFDGNSMFFATDTDTERRTHLLDALDLVGFWPEDKS